MAVRGSRAVTVACLVLLLGSTLGACTSSGDPPPAEAATGEVWRVPRIADGTVEGVAAEFTPATGPRDLDAPRRPPPGEVELRACRWRGPGLYTFDLTFTPASGTELPTSFPLSLEYYTGDMGSGGSGDVTVSRGGDFSVTINENERRAAWNETNSTESRWDGMSYGYSGEPNVRCQARWETGDPEVGTASSESLPMSVDVYDDGYSMPEGSVEALARSADPTDQPSVAATVRHLLAHEDLPELDRLYLAPGAPLTAISVQVKANCIEVRSTYPFDAQWQEVIEVTQGLRCPEPGSWAARPVVGIVDDVWEVRVTGPREHLDTFVSDQLQLLYMATVEPFDPGAGTFDPDAAADAEIAERGLIELTRFDWNGGVVAIVAEGHSNWGPSYEPLVFLPRGAFLGGGGGMQCRTHSSLFRFDGSEGFAAVVTERPGLRVVMQSDEMEPVDVPLEPIEGGREAGLVSLDGLDSTYSLTFTAFDVDGLDLGCDQTPTTTS